MLCQCPQHCSWILLLKWCFHINDFNFVACYSHDCECYTNGCITCYWWYGCYVIMKAFLLLETSCDWNCTICTATLLFISPCQRNCILSLGSSFFACTTWILHLGQFAHDLCLLIWSTCLCLNPSKFFVFFASTSYIDVRRSHALYVWKIDKIVGWWQGVWKKFFYVILSYCRAYCITAKKSCAWMSWE